MHCSGLFFFSSRFARTKFRPYRFFSPGLLLLQHERYFFPGVDSQREAGLLLAVQFRLVPHRNPAGLAVDRERLARVDQVVDELAVVALVQVGGDHPQHVVPVGDVLGHGHVVRVQVELGLVVVNVDRLDFHLGERPFRRVVRVDGLDLAKD